MTRGDRQSTRLSLAGIATLAACACGTSSRIGLLTRSFGVPLGIRNIHLLFVAIGGLAILAGLWKRNRIAAGTALAGVGLLLAGEVLAPPMSLSSRTTLSGIEWSGIVSSLAAGALMVWAFFRAYPTEKPGSVLTAMTGMAMATGCNCCLITMAIVTLAHSIAPSQQWLGQTASVYVAAVLLMSVGLTRLGGFLPVLPVIIGQAWVYFWLQLPYSSMPALSLHGADVNFVIKYPMMFTGALVVLGGFVLAYRARESGPRAIPVAEPAFGD